VNFARSNGEVDLAQRDGARETFRQPSEGNDRFAAHRPNVLVLIQDKMFGLRPLLARDHIVADILGIVHGRSSIDALDFFAFQNIKQ